MLSVVTAIDSVCVGASFSPGEEFSCEHACVLTSCPSLSPSSRSGAGPFWVFPSIPPAREGGGQPLSTAHARTSSLFLARRAPAHTHPRMRAPSSFLHGGLPPIGRVFYAARRRGGKMPTAFRQDRRRLPMPDALSSTSILSSAFSSRKDGGETGDLVHAKQRP